jgi:hypothetical protein
MNRPELKEGLIKLPKPSEVREDFRQLVAEMKTVEDGLMATGANKAQRTREYVIYFELQRVPGNVRQIAIRATDCNLRERPLDKFLVQYGVSQGWVIAVQPPSGNLLEPSGGRPIQQLIMLENRGGTPLAMVTQTSYMYGTQLINETGRINPIFG